MYFSAVPSYLAYGTPISNYRNQGAVVEIVWGRTTTKCVFPMVPVYL